MLRSIELDAIRENQSNVRDELVRREVPWLVRFRNHLSGCGVFELLLDRLEIHGVRDYFRVVRDVHSHDINGGQERSCVSRPFQVLESRGEELVLRCCQRRSEGQVRGRGLSVGRGGICWRGVTLYTIHVRSRGRGRRRGSILVNHKKNMIESARPNLQSTKTAQRRQGPRTDITEAASASECFLALFAG